MSIKFSSLFFLLAFVSITIADNNTRVYLTVKIHNFRNNNGVVFVTLFDTTSAKDYPSTKHSICTKQTKITGLNALVIFDSLLIGNYAILLHHDEDNDGKLKTGMFGMPKEGIGFSNNIRPGFGPPKFKEAKFEISKKNQIIDIDILYL